MVMNLDVIEVRIKYQSILAEICEIDLNVMSTLAVENDPNSYSLLL